MGCIKWGLFRLSRIIVSFLILNFTLLFLTSCNKRKFEYHKITYELEFYKNSDAGYSNFIDVGCKPAADAITLDRFNMPKIVRNEYWGLLKGNEIYFSVWAQTGYWFSMRLKIDDVLISEREVKIGNSSYYVPEYYKQIGPNEHKGDAAIIILTY